MKYILVLLLFFVSLTYSRAQILYEDNESTYLWGFDWANGTYQRGVEAPDDASRKVTRYERSASQYDVLRISLTNRLSEINTYLSGSKKFKLDFYSEHPGTAITLVFANGAKAAGAYPSGRHSEFMATTTKTNEWETLEFTFSYQPDPLVILPEIDQLYFMIAPNTTTTVGRIYYYDNFYGPEIIVPKYSGELYENAEDITVFTYPWSSGSLTRNYANPAPDTVNASSNVLRYERSTSDYDVLFADVSNLGKLEPYLGNDRKMTLQVYSPAPGIQINLSLEDKDKSTAAYPAGRHSVFTATTTTSGEWETLVFNFSALIDASVSVKDVDRFVFMIAPNNPAAVGTYYLDNFYGPEMLTSDFSALSINEVMNSNGSALSDIEGDENDWIEIYNSGNYAVDLTGFHLSDKQDLPLKWAFPDVTVYAGEFLLVWASTKDRYSYGEVHTNFGLGSDEHLLFSSPAGDTVAYLPPVELPTDISYGRQPDATGSFVLFNVPTPGASNTTTGYSGMQGKAYFSIPGGFYNDPLSLTLTAAQGSEIRYTLDGAEPNESSPLYTAPLAIESRVGDPNVISEIKTTETGAWLSPGEEVFKSRVVRARVFKAGQIPGPVVTHTYFVGDNIAQRYHVPVISLVTDSVNLFGYESGIYVPGMTHDNWLEDNPGGQADGGTPANYNREGVEKDVSVEFFEPGGMPGFRLNGGLAIHGGYSRAATMKSLRIAFRKEYDTANTLTYPLFPGLQKRGAPGNLTEFRRFLLRNSGNDFGRTMFRDALMQELIDHTGLDRQAYRPSVVFINGEYWGMHNIRERIDEFLIAGHHDINPEQVVILNVSGAVDDGAPGDQDHYTQMIDFLGTNNVADSAAYAFVKDRIDVENYIHYQTAEIFYGNRDWPGNNVKMWRYKGNSPEAGGTKDGRWRWIVYDTDFSFGIYGSDPAYDNLAFATATNGPGWPNPPWSTFLLRTLLENDSFRKDFINYFADHLNSSFKVDRMLNVIDGMQQHIAPLMAEHVARWKEPGSLNTWHNYLEEIQEYAQQRPAHQVTHLKDYFGLSERETIMVDVNNTSAGKVKVNSMIIDSDLPGVDPSVYPWSGLYFPEVEVTVTAVPERGYKFIGWNGNSSSNMDTTVFVSDTTYLTAYFDVLTAEDILPSPHVLELSDYRFNSWEKTEPVLTYPSSMIFLQSTIADPGEHTNFPHPYDLPYNLKQGTRIEGLGEDGMAFINTGSTDNLYPNATGRDLGVAVLALNTQNVPDVYVSFLAGTVVPNDIIYRIRLQYRIGKDGSFQDVIEDNFPVEYLQSHLAGHTTHFSNILLPQEVAGNEYVELRWVYYYISGPAGGRGKLRLDDIKVSTEPLLVVKDTDFSSGVTIYPNPANGPFSFEMKGEYYGEVELTIADVNGKEVDSYTCHKESSRQNWQPDITLPGSGIYFVRWKCGERQGVQKLVMMD